MSNANSLISRERDHLTELDAAIGDADHGVNLARGFARAHTVIAQGLHLTGTPASILSSTGRLLMSEIGGAAGPLYGSALFATGSALPDNDEVNPAEFAAALQAGLESIQVLGAAKQGDKTMVDSYTPAVAAFRRAAATGFGPATQAAASAAEAGMRATIPLQAAKGRASYLGLRSIGHQDPGATSTALVFRALADTLRTAEQSCACPTCFGLRPAQPTHRR
ncbi:MULTISPECIES: dihydroxyacetone kinase subunit DhaL [unclassified Streptomyces]|uniref:dihydroxyacetone kinase subunit DhaL n=1 Tax=unclassified Streptomyces TaxID=2593676 RepID=UPI0028804ABB|nr:dihydroxyacetone kinase subunit DhaL [Streptomyces sp. I6]